MDLKNFLYFYTNDEYEFAKCEGCYDPLLGHLEVKCSSKEGVRYGNEAVRSFENWFKRVSGFKEALAARNQRKEDIRSAKIREAVRLAIESVEKKNRPEAKTTQLLKARLPPLW